MIRVELKANGSVEAITRLTNIAHQRGFTVRVEDAGLATGSGRIEIEFPYLDEQNEAHAAARALIGEVPGGSEFFAIV